MLLIDCAAKLPMRLRKMLRSELVQLLIKANPDLPKDTIRTIVEFFFTTIVDQLVAGGRVELRGFGTFSTRSREARSGHNPRNGEMICVAATKKTYFRASRALHLKG